MTAKTILVIIGDTHIGSSTALAPPTFTIHNQHTLEEQLVNHNRLQEWLWGNWIDFWDYVKLLAYEGGKRRKNRIVVVHMGDVIDGNHHKTMQIIQDPLDQAQVALDILQPIVDMSDAFFGVIGTGAHGGESGSDEVSIYKALGVTEYGQNLMLEIDGKLHDFAHHGRTGTRPWTSAAASIGVEVMLDCAQQGVPLPNYIWRGHKHNIDDSGNKLEGTRVITLPSWQLKTAWTYSVVANKMRSDIGGYIVNGGLIDESRSRYRGQPDERKIIRL